MAHHFAFVKRIEGTSLAPADGLGGTAPGGRHGGEEDEVLELVI